MESTTIGELMHGFIRFCDPAGKNPMRKLSVLAYRLMISVCFAMVALFVYDLIFWSQTLEEKLASKVLILFFSLMGFCIYLVNFILNRASTTVDRKDWSVQKPLAYFQMMESPLPFGDDGVVPRNVPGISNTAKFKAVCLAALGYGYVCGLLFILLAVFYRASAWVIKSPEPLMFFLVSSPLLAVVLLLLKAVLTPVWIRTEAPDGLEITPFDAPELFETINRIRKLFKGPGFSRVVLTGDFNAFIVQTPSLGVFGWHENHLVLGLPLLQALSPKQFMAVLAHELGHGRLGSRILNIRNSWMQLEGNLNGSRLSRALMARFFHWYAPFFHAQTSEIQRAYEHEADLCSVVIAGKTETAAALVRSDVLSMYLLERFWPMITEMMETMPSPVESVFGLMQENFRKGVEEEKAREWFERALSAETGPDDTHPCLKDRLKAIAEPPVFRNSLEQSAAHYFFPHIDDLRMWFDDQWSSQVRSQWVERYAESRKLKTRLEELTSKAKSKPLNVEETLELAHLTEEVSGCDKAFPLYERILKYKPTYVPALCAVGRISLEKGDESGVDFIEKAIDLDANYSVHGLETLYHFYLEKGDREKVGKYYQKLSEQRDMAERPRP